MKSISSNLFLTRRYILTFSDFKSAEIASLLLGVYHNKDEIEFSKRDLIEIYRIPKEKIKILEPNYAVLFLDELISNNTKRELWKVLAEETVSWIVPYVYFYPTDTYKPNKYPLLDLYLDL